ncbi:phosphopantetheine-binding protein [Streptomyces sp. BE20]|uniref:phosphopantetheine-binding protein n=1 Tax=Streptomyces sp. BE20 TaxID=3002525 RepID=UPI002E79812F|nr:phosphopantetheine-binding protein [Streptomyces sp. BE20]MEE1822054.1 phosphopantetheine-binding protein [Streptomyces sp. BE20]
MNAAAPAPADALRRRLAALLSDATDGQLGQDELLASDTSLTALGVSSLALLRLADGLEEEYEVLIDLGDPALHAEGLDGLAERLRRLGVEPTG